jgi:hypothetical protein
LAAHGEPRKGLTMMGNAKLYDRYASEVDVRWGCAGGGSLGLWAPPLESHGGVAGGASRH